MEPLIRSRAETTYFATPPDMQATFEEQLMHRLEVPGKVVCIGSWLSGEGRSTLAAHLALALARRERRVAVLDLGGGARTISFLFNLWPVRSLDDVQRGQSQLDEIILRTGTGVDLVPGTSPDNREPVDYSKTFEILAVLEKLPRDYDFVIVDCPAGAARWLISIWQMASAVITVVTPESLEIDSRWSFESVLAATGACRLFVANKMGQEAEFDLKVGHLLSENGIPGTTEIIGLIRWHESIANVIRNGLPVHLDHPSPAALAELDALAKRLVQVLEQAEVSTGKGHGLALLDEIAGTVVPLVDGAPDAVAHKPKPEPQRKSRVTPDAAKKSLEELAGEIEEYAGISGMRSLNVLVGLASHLDGKRDAGKFIAEMILALERQYYARFRKPVRWIDEDVLQDMLAEEFSEAALLRLNRHLQLSFRMRFNRDLTDPLAELVAQIRAPSYRKDQFLSLQHSLMQAYAQRFGSPYSDVSPGAETASKPPVRPAPPSAFEAFGVTPVNVIEERARTLEQRRRAGGQGAKVPMSPSGWTKTPIPWIPRRSVESMIAASALVLMFCAVVLNPYVQSMLLTPVTPTATTVEPIPLSQPLGVPTSSITEISRAEALPAPAYDPAPSLGSDDNVEAEVAVMMADVQAHNEPTSAGPATQVAMVNVGDVTFEATADCWIDVVDKHGERIARELLKQGGSATYRGVFPVSVTLGNSRAVNVSVNGETFDLTPYQKRRVAHFVLGQKS